MIVATIAFFLMLAAMALMAVGMIRGKKLKGSCGGLSCSRCRNESGCHEQTGKNKLPKE